MAVFRLYGSSLNEELSIEICTNFKVKIYRFFQSQMTVYCLTNHIYYFKEDLIGFLLTIQPP